MKTITKQRLCDKCEHFKTCDGPKWCRGFKDYISAKKVGNAEWVDDKKFEKISKTP